MSPPPISPKTYTISPQVRFNNGLSGFASSNAPEVAVLMKKLKSLQKQLQDGCLITLITNPRLHREKNKMFALDSRGHEEDSAKCNAELRLLFVVAHPNAKRPQGVIHLLALTDKTDQQDSIDYWRPKLNLLDPPP